MRRFLFGITLVPVLFSLDAKNILEARTCPHGQIKRVSLGICVGAHSRAARGYLRPSGHRRHHHKFRRRQFRHMDDLPIPEDEMEGKPVRQKFTQEACFSSDSYWMPVSWGWPEIWVTSQGLSPVRKWELTN